MDKFADADLCFICDITQSMDKHKLLITDGLLAIIDKLCNNAEEKPRVSFIGFRDKCDKENQINKLDFTTPENAKEHITNVECEGGGDPCEDLVTPLISALSLNWRADLKYVYMLIDAPTHGSSYHDPKYGDDYLGEDKRMLLEK